MYIIGVYERRVLLVWSWTLFEAENIGVGRGSTIPSFSFENGIRKFIIKRRAARSAQSRSRRATVPNIVIIYSEWACGA